MAIRVALHHRTRYAYDRRVSLSPQVIRLRPAPHSRTRILSYSLRVTPEEQFLNWQQDPQSNYLARLVFPKPATELRVEVDEVHVVARQLLVADLPGTQETLDGGQGGVVGRSEVCEPIAVLGRTPVRQAGPPGGEPVGFERGRRDRRDHNE